MDHLKIMEKMEYCINQLEKGQFSDGKVFSSQPKVRDYAVEMNGLLQSLKNQIVIKQDLDIKPLKPNTYIEKRVVSTYNYYSDSEKDKINKVAYFMSKYEHHDLFKDGLNQTETFNKAAGLLKVKVTTLRNKRDSYDPYFNNGRVGWVQADHLSGDMLRIKQLYDTMSKQEILQDIGRFLC